MSSFAEYHLVVHVAEGTKHDTDDEIEQLADALDILDPQMSLQAVADRIMELDPRFQVGVIS